MVRISMNNTLIENREEIQQISREEEEEEDH